MGLTIINRQIVKPASPTWEGIMPLTELDQYGIVAREGFVQLYKTPSKPRHIILETFKNALSQALVWFYPIAGELQSIGKDRYEINCNATGVMLIEAESTSRLEDFGDFSSLDLFAEGLYPNYRQMDGHNIKSPITLVQLTWLQCGSISIGYATSQVVVDGTGFMHFVRELARLARGEPIISPPSLDRQALLQLPPHGLATASYTPIDPLIRKPSLVVGQIWDPEEHLPKPKIRMATLELTKDQVVTLLNLANGSRSGSHQGRHYSRFEAIAGHIWRCVVKARGNISSQRTSMCYPIDMRHRMGLPQSYFGVAIMAGVTSSVVEELISIPLSKVCGKIRKQTNAMTKEYVWSVMEFSKAKKSMSIHQDFFQGNPNLDITSWLSLPTRDVDYGWGRDVYMAAALEYEGCYVLNRGHEKDGSVLVTFSMDVDHMEDFKKYFYEDINGDVVMRAKI